MNSNEISDLISETMRKIELAARKGDLSGVTQLTQHAQELEKLKSTADTLRQRVDAIRSGISAKPNMTSGSSPLRELPLQVTQGMINQNLLTLSPHVKARRIQQGEDLIVETKPFGEKFRTIVMANGNKLQERGAIGRFYREASVKEGDFVVLEEVARGIWNLSKAPPGKYQSPFDSLLAELQRL